MPEIGTRPFLVIQLRPEGETADSEFKAILEYGGLATNEVVRARVEKNGLPAIDLDNFAAIIVGGSPFDISTPESDKTSIQKQIETGFMELLGRVVERDFPFLGACSGNGLLGKYCGTNISGKFAEPVSAVDITQTEAGMADPLLAGLPATFRVLLGHKEACDALPTGATLLASSDACPVQMFRLGQNIYATQFHPEADADGFAVRINVYKNHGYFPPHEAEQLKTTIGAEDTPHAREILRRFVDRYRDTGALQ